jgi:hypothetical protein
MHTVPAMLIAASALVILFLGTMHLVLTFRGTAFHPRDPALTAAMKADSPRISRATTMWRAGMGFHASHSLGAIMFGVMYAYLALEGSGFLFQSLFLIVFGMVVLLAYLALARLYWFKVPFRGIAIASQLYGAGLAVHLAG